MADQIIIDRFYASHRELRLAGTDHRRESGFVDIVRFFGPDGIDPSACPVQAIPDRFALTDPVVRAHADRIAGILRAEGRLYDGPDVMKLHALRYEQSSLRCVVQPCSYADQAGSCFALDEPIEGDTSGQSLRDYLHASNVLGGVVEKNPLGVCFGVCGYLIGRGGPSPWLLQIRRAGHLSSLAGSLGPTVAGSVDYDSSLCTLNQIVHVVLGRETSEELAVGPELCSITPLAFAREIKRGERPQLFAVIETPLSPPEILGHLSQVPEPAREFCDPVFIDMSNGIPDHVVKGVNVEAAMNLLLLEEWLATKSSL